jgi:trehalose synthase
VEECAERIVHVLKDGDMRIKIGEKAVETVREKFLLTRLIEQYLDLLSSFETCFTLKKNA